MRFFRVRRVVDVRGFFDVKSFFGVRHCDEAFSLSLIPRCLVSSAYQSQIFAQHIATPSVRPKPLGHALRLSAC
jgi:hypothetical protein